MKRFDRHPRACARIAMAAVLCMAGGCVASEPVPQIITAFIGKDAQLVARGKPPLTWKVTSAGNLAVMDRTAGGILAFCSIKNPGQLLSIDPDEGTVVLKSATDADRFDSLASDIDPSHEFAVYFTAIKPPPSQGVSKRPTP